MQQGNVTTLITSLLALLTVSAGCTDAPDQQEAPPVLSAAADPAASEAAASGSGDSAADSPAKGSPTAGGSTGVPARHTHAGLSFEFPASWNQLELSPMQQGIIAARYTIPAVSEGLTLTLSRSGGSTDDNLNRWRGQMEASTPEVSESVTVGGEEASLLDMQGRFSAGFGRSPENDWRMIGVIVPMEPQDYFIKLTGPIDAVASVKEAFDKFLESARQE